MRMKHWAGLADNTTSTVKFLQQVNGTAPTLAALAGSDMPANVFLKDSDQTLSDGVDITVGSTNGTKIGTATTQKIAFYNSSPIVQPLLTADLLDSLQALGLIASGAGDTPLNLSSGALTCGALTVKADSSLDDGVDIALATTNGTKIGTATNQKLGFFNATPVVQQTVTTDLLDALQALGFIASGAGDTPLNLSAGALVCGTVAASGAITPTGGVAAAGGFSATARLCHTGGVPAQVSTDGTELDAVITELYVAEVFIPANCTVTGAAVLWGTNTNGNAKVMLFDSAGTRVAISASTDVSGFTGDSYGSRIAFSAPYSAKGPATYYLGVICDDANNDINTHTLGNFGAGKITGLVYATEAGYATITPPTTFTTGLGPIATLY